LPDPLPNAGRCTDYSNLPTSHDNRRRAQQTPGMFYVDLPKMSC
jgi:hypothetical protein